jgi:hypothetical protein
MLHPSYRPPNRGFVFSANRIEVFSLVDHVTTGLGGYVFVDHENTRAPTELAVTS